MLPRLLRPAAFMLVFLAFAVFTHNTEASSWKWWERHDEGWYFYRDPDPEPAQKPPSPPDIPMVEAKKPDPPPLATELMKREGDRLLSEAMLAPTDENVRSYMEYQKEMMAMSERFAYVWQRVLMKYPDLYRVAETEKTNEDIRKAVSMLGARTGLFFIYSSECEACVKSASIVEEFRRKYDFAVLPVTIDGIALPELPDTRPDNGIASRLGIDTVPAWYLAYPGEDRFEHIGTGHMPLSELERRLYRYAITENISVYTAHYPAD